MNILPEVKTWVPFTLTEWATFVKDHKGQWIELIEQKLGGKLYGGYLEDRSSVFDNRHEKDFNCHLGVDFWLPAGTSVIWPFETGTIVHTSPGNPLCRGGWGGRIDILAFDTIFVFGHLDPDTITRSLVQYGTIGQLGIRSKNGGWLPHLHLQCISTEFYKRFEDPRSIDAYAPNSPTLSSDFPNPLPFIQRS